MRRRHKTQQALIFMSIVASGQEMSIAKLLLFIAACQSWRLSRLACRRKCLFSSAVGICRTDAVVNESRGHERSRSDGDGKAFLGLKMKLPSTVKPGEKSFQMFLCGRDGEVVCGCLKFVMSYSRGGRTRGYW